MPALSVMKTFMIFALLGLMILGSSCSPLKSSPHEQSHQMELTLHEVQTNLDDVQNDLNSYQTEQQILDGRIKQQENALTKLKHQFLEIHLAKIENLQEQVKSLESQIVALQSVNETSKTEMRNLSLHANETTSALTQYKEKIRELEKLSNSQNQRMKEVVKLKDTLDSLLITLRDGYSEYNTYKVSSGDTLEKIAKTHQTHVQTLKKMNHLKNDILREGQELKIPKK